MRLLVLSELHLEFGAPMRVPQGIEFNVAVLAGDIHNPASRAVVEWATYHEDFAGRPVILVPGNHEFYGGVLDASLLAMLSAVRLNMRLEPARMPTLEEVVARLGNDDEK